MTVPNSATFNLTFNEIQDAAIARIGGEKTLGFTLKSARRAGQLMFQDWQNRGLNFWTAELITLTTLTTPALVAGTAAYTLAADTVDVMEAYSRTYDNSGNGATSPTDLVIARTGRTEYAYLPNKLDQGTPYLYYLDRQRDAPVLYLYPTPSVQFLTLYPLGGAILFYIIRRTKDINAQSDYVDVPARFLAAFVSGLAWYMSRERPEVSGDIRDRLKKEYDEDLGNAISSDRDSAPTTLMVDLSSYFR